MVTLKTIDQIKTIYASVTNRGKLLYHIAHGRKENTDREYDGEELVAIAKKRARRDISKLRAASEEFRHRSIPRK